jgi:hypothetical protein
MSTESPQLVAIDGSDALAFVVLRPGSRPGLIAVDGAVHGVDKRDAAAALRRVAARWETEAARGEVG